MISLLTGENSYEVEQALGRIVGAFNGTPEKFDGSELELRNLPDLLTGMSLFDEKRLIIIRDLSGNKQLWESLPPMIERMSDAIHLVLVESAVDKRTKTYKALQGAADVSEHKYWTERDNRQAERWIQDQAKRLNVRLVESAASMLLHRSLLPTERGQPVIDQWRLVHMLEQLSVFEEVTPDVVEKYTEEQPVDSVFSVFETALKGDALALHSLLDDLRPKEDPFKVFGLLSSQVFQLAVLAVSDSTSADTAKAIGVHPYALSKLAPYARKLKRTAINRAVLALKEADESLKLSKADPWVLIEQALMKIATATNSK